MLAGLFKEESLCNLDSRLSTDMYCTYDCMVDAKTKNPCAYLTSNSHIRLLF